MTPKTRADYEQEWREGVRSEINRANTRLDEVLRLVSELRSTELSKMKADIAVLKVKAGMWGVVGGTVASGLVSLLVKLMLHT